MSAIEMTMTDLFPQTPSPNGSHRRGDHGRIVATYDYEDEAGNLLYQVVRFEPKGFRQRRPDGNGRWIWNLGNTSRTLFRLPKLLAADPADTVCVAEGEKDVDAVERLGLVATTNSGGAAKWRSGFSEVLRDRAVVVLPDNDVPGRNHAEKVAASLHGIAASVKVVDLPGLPPGGDVSDWIDAGGTKDELLHIIAEAPEWTPRPAELPTIIVGNSQMRDLTDEALGAVCRRNCPPTIFKRSGRICRVRHDERGRVLIEDLSEHALRGEMERAANFRKVSRQGAESPVPPPLYIVQDAETQRDWDLPPIEGVVRCPVLREDGSVLLDVGYDAVSRLYYSPSPDLDVPPVVDTPTQEDVDAARALIEEVVADFPFVDPTSKANAVGLMVTPILRPMVAGGVPLAFVDAPQRGTGKTLLAEVVGTISMGRAELMGAPQREEEWQKLITAGLAEGTTFFAFDNLRGPLKSPALERTLTAIFVADRQLGHTRMLRLPQRATWVATSNNATISGDLSRRCYWIRLDAKMARPWTDREFTHPDLLRWVGENRGRLLHALLTLARAWVAAGRPAGNAPRLGKYEDWCEIVGGVLTHAGIDGFLGNIEEMYETLDEGHAQWEGFLRAWQKRYGEDAVTVSRLVEGMFEESILEAGGESLRVCLPDELTEAVDAVRDGRGRASFSKKLGKALTKHRDMRYGTDGLRLEKAPADAHRKVNAWRVTSDAGFAGFAGVPRADSRASEGNFPDFVSDPAQTNPLNPQTPQARDPAPGPAEDQDPWDEFEERAAIREFDGGLSREEAEALARPMSDPDPSSGEGADVD